MRPTSHEGTKANLLVRLGVLLREEGFAPDPSEQLLRKRIEGGSHLLFLTYSESRNEFDVMAKVAVRLDAVQELLYRGVKLSARDKKRTSTVGADLGNLIDGRHLYWTIGTEADVESVALAIASEMKEFGVLYLERMSDPETILQTLRSNDSAAWRHSPVHLTRCKTVLAVASVLRGASGVADLLPEMERFLKSRKDAGLGELTGFGESLLDS